MDISNSIVLKAKDGYVYTDGQIYAKEVYVTTPPDSVDNWKEIPESEIPKEEEETE